MKAERYGATLMRTARYMTRIYNRHLARVSLTISQHGILEAIAQLGPVAHQDLADTLVTERSALQRSLQPLLRAEFVTSNRDSTNRKRLLYKLTDEGRQLLSAALYHVSAAEMELDGLFEHIVIPDGLCVRFIASDTIAMRVDNDIAAI